MDKKNKVQRIFDSISPRYDFLNHLLSGGIDFYWRRKALKLTGINPDAKLLDVACGTGDFSISAKKFGVTNITGADLSLNMLKIFSEKTEDIRGRTVQCVAEHLPFKNNSFTNITVGFGVRNFYDIREGFKSFYRVLQPEGKAAILEFRMPANPIVKAFYNFYFTTILPLVGRLISKDPEAYTYLPESVRDFDKNINITELLKQAGFNNIEYKALTFGIVQIVIGIK